MRALLSLAVVCATFAARAETLVIRNVDVVSMRDARIDRRQTVIVRGDHIESVDGDQQRRAGRSARGRAARAVAGW